MMNFCRSCRNNRRGSTEYEAIGNSFSESSSLVSNSLKSPNRASDDLNLWSNPNDFTHTKERDDRELSTLLEQRDSAVTASSYQIASDQIERIRTNRRKVQDRWKSVLRELGFEDEDELQKLVTVTPLSQAGTSHFSMQADSLHSALVRETMIFGRGPSQRNRYATVLSRLIDLDTADDFLAMARKLYPQVDHKIISDLEWDYRSTDSVNSKRPRPAHSNHRVDQNLQQTNSNALEVSYSANNNEIQIKGDEYL